VHAVARGERGENVECGRPIEGGGLDVGKAASSATLRSVRDCSGYEVS